MSLVNLSQNRETAQSSVASAQSSVKNESATDSKLKIQFEQFKILADQGNPSAQVKVGDMYLQGAGVTKSKTRAFKYYKLAADRNHSHAQYKVACLFEKGIGTAPSLVDAIDYYEKARTNRVKAADSALMIAFQALKKRADKDKDDIDLGHVGYFYECGIGTKPDLSQAFAYYKQSADSGNRRAQHQIAGMYKDGLGVEQSIRDAYRYYDQLISQGADYEKYTEAVRDRDTMMCEVNQSYRDLITQYTPEALIKQAKIHKRIGGRGYLSAAAIDLLRTAANEPHNSPKAQFQLARMLRKRADTDWGKEVANIYNTRAAQAGHPKAKKAKQDVSSPEYSTMSVHVSNPYL